MTVLAVMVFMLPGCKDGRGERILFDFESDSELDQFHWKCHTLFSLSKEHVSHGKQSLKLELYPDEYPGIAPKIKNTDWSRFRAFSFDVYNAEGKNFPLTVRIDDRKDYPAYGDRFNKTFPLTPGRNTVTIPLDTLRTTDKKRHLNLENIYRIIIFVAKPEHKIVLYFDYLRLE